MNIIIKKVRLVAAPEPAFVGTTLTVGIAADRLGYGIYAAELAEGHENAVVDWGDGVTEQVAAFPARHTYVGQGTYSVRISDDLATLRVCAVNPEEKDIDFNDYPPSLLGFTSNAQNLQKLGKYGFFLCENMTEFDVTDCSAYFIGPCLFKNCYGLPPKVYLPNISTYEGNGVNAPFRNDTNILEIHFASNNEASIRAVPTFEKEPNLGARNATVIFDP